MTTDIKTMQLYPRASRIYDDLRALGHADDTPLSVDLLNRFDQLHYHGTEAVDAAIHACGITKGSTVLEVGSGWGGCARYLSQRTGARVSAVELQPDYDAVARDLTARTGLSDHVTHLNEDFLEIALDPASFDHAVSWLALFHIPQRETYLAKLHAALKPGSMFFAEDLYQLKEPTPEARADFARHLFANSLVSKADYQSTLEQAGFERVEMTDMTADWTAFTASRLAAFRASRADYEAIHGPEGFATIEIFYDKMAGFFTQGLVGGLRFAARRSG